MAAAMIRQRPIDTSPINVASAVFCRSTISAHSEYGVSRSITTKETVNTTMPRNAKTRAANRVASPSSSCPPSLARRGTVDGAIGTRVVADRAGDVADARHRGQRPAAVLGRAEQANDDRTVKQIA